MSGGGAEGARGSAAVMLGTPRLVLRAPTLADAPRWELLCQPLEVAKNTLRMPHPYPAGAAAEWMARVEPLIEKGEVVRLGIFLRDERGGEGPLIGMTGLHDISDVHKHAELGYTLGLDYWGKGYASEAAGAMVDFAFGTLGLERVHAAYFTRNPASGRVLEKVGFVREGLRERMYFRFGEWVDVAMMRLLRHEWEARRGQRGGRDAAARG